MKQFLLSLTVLASFLLTSCSSPNIDAKQAKPLVVVSIPPYVSLIRAIAGDTVDVQPALPANFDPHTTEITPHQRELIQHASVFVGIGEPYERKLLKALQLQNPSLLIVPLNAHTPLISYDHDTHCPGACHSSDEAKDIHFWLSPKRLKGHVEILTHTLSQLQPDFAALYEKNATSYTTDIETLDRHITKVLAPYASKGIIVSHAALGYFCHDYKLLQFAVEYEGKSPLPQDVNRILDQIATTEIICVFTAPQYNNIGAEMIARKLHLRTHHFDPLAEDLLHTLKHIATDIASYEHHRF